MLCKGDFYTCSNSCDDTVLVPGNQEAFTEEIFTSIVNMEEFQAKIESKLGKLEEQAIFTGKSKNDNE